MRNHKSVLIQDIREFTSLLSIPIREIMASHYWTGITEESILQWVIAEELELIYGLFVRNHKHNFQPHCFVHNQLNSELMAPLSVLVSHYIKAPRIYAENANIVMEIKSPDLYLHYTAIASDYIFHNPPKK